MKSILYLILITIVVILQIIGILLTLIQIPIEYLGNIILDLIEKIGLYFKQLESEE